MPLKELPYLEGAMLLTDRLSSLTVLRSALREPPLYSLGTLLEQLLRQDAFAAADAYRALCHALLTGNYRRVSGDLFRDYVLWLLLERENHFSALAAESIWDEPLSAAMRMDLHALAPLLELNSVTMKRWIGDCFKEHRTKPRQNKDNIAVLSSAVWGGASTRPPLPKEPAAFAAAQLPARALDENELLSWRYQFEPPPEEAMLFVAESAMEELSHRLNEVEDPGMLLDDLWSFHATYGTGAFIRDRLFLLHEEEGLRPISPALLPQEDTYAFYEAQREQALHNTIHFMRGEPYQNMLITGGEGTGKTSQVFSLCRELPEIRMVCCPPGAYAALVKLIPALCRQPLKFVLFLDDYDEQHPQWPHVKAAAAPAGMQAANLLLVAAAVEARSAYFPMHVQLPPPQLKDFIELVQLMLLREGFDVDFDSIQNACIDYATLHGNNRRAGDGFPLSFRSAEIIAGSLKQ